MTQEFEVEALGVCLRIEVAGMSASDLRRLRAQWRRVHRGRVPGHRAPSATLSAVLGEHAPGADVCADGFDELSVRLRQAINLRAIEARRAELLMFHAAGLAHPATGDVIALVGPSGAGKTTAASTLGTVLGYVSDETVAVDAAGGVASFPKPLAVKQQGFPGKKILGPDALGLREARGALRLSRIALLDRRDEPVAPTVTTKGLEDVVGAIVEQTNHFAALPAALRRLAALVHVSGGVHVIRYHHAAELIEPVTALLRRPAAHLAPAQHGAAREAQPEAAAHPEAAALPATAVPPAVLPPGSYARAAVDDWVAVADEVMVLRDGRISRLSPLGSLLWSALREPRSLSELVARAEAAFGPAPGSGPAADSPEAGAATAVAAMLGELEAAGLVRSRPALP